MSSRFYLAPCLLALLLPACSNTPVSATGTPAFLTLTVQPNPIIATNTLNPSFYDYDISWSVTITETAGVGGLLNFVKGTLYDPSTGLAAGPPTILDSSDLLVLVGANRVNPSGKVVVSNQRISYRLPSRGRAALLAVDVEMKDDNGNLLDPSILVPVQ